MSSRNSIVSRTVMLKKIPRFLVERPESLKWMWEQGVGAGKVENITVCPNETTFIKIIKNRANSLVKLEREYEKILGNPCTHPDYDRELLYTVIMTQAPDARGKENELLTRWAQPKFLKKGTHSNGAAKDPVLKRPHMWIKAPKNSEKLFIKVDKIDYLRGEFYKLDKLASEIRLLFKEPNPSSNAFVTFEDAATAHMVCQLSTYPNPSKMVVSLASESRSIYWENITMSRQKLRFRKYSKYIMLLMLMLLWVPPVVFLGSLLSPATLSQVNFLQEAFVKYPFVQTLVLSTVPPLALVLFFNLLPWILKQIVLYGGAQSHQSLDFSVLCKTWLFLVYNVIGVLCISGSVWEVLVKVLDDPRSLLQKFGDTLPGFGSFFTSYVFLLGVLFQPFKLLQLRPVLWHILRKWICHTPREYSSLAAPVYIDWYSIYPYPMLVFTISILYSTFSPIVVCISVVYFGIGYIVLKYQLLYVYFRNYESCGMMWPKVLVRMTISVILFQLVVTFFVITKTSGYWGLGMIPLIIASFVFLFGYSAKCEKKFEFIPMYLWRHPPPNTSYPPPPTEANANPQELYLIPRSQNDRAYANSNMIHPSDGTMRVPEPNMPAHNISGYTQRNMHESSAFRPNQGSQNRHQNHSLDLFSQNQTKFNGNSSISENKSGDSIRRKAKKAIGQKSIAEMVAIGGVNYLKKLATMNSTLNRTNSKPTLKKQDMKIMSTQSWDANSNRDHSFIFENLGTKSENNLQKAKKGVSRFNQDPNKKSGYKLMSSIKGKLGRYHKHADELNSSFDISNSGSSNLTFEEAKILEEMVQIEEGTITSKSFDNMRKSISRPIKEARYSSQVSLISRNSRSGIRNRFNNKMIESSEDNASSLVLESQKEIPSYSTSKNSSNSSKMIPVSKASNKFEEVFSSFDFCRSQKDMALFNNKLQDKSKLDSVVVRLPSIDSVSSFGLSSARNSEYYDGSAYSRYRMSGYKTRNNRYSYFDKNRASNTSENVSKLGYPDFLENSYTGTSIGYSNGITSPLKAPESIYFSRSIDSKYDNDLGLSLGHRIDTRENSQRKYIYSKIDPTQNGQNWFPGRTSDFNFDEAYNQPFFNSSTDNNNRYNSASRNLESLNSSSIYFGKGTTQYKNSFDSFSQYGVSSYSGSSFGDRPITQNSNGSSATATSAKYARVIKDNLLNIIKKILYDNFNPASAILDGSMDVIFSNTSKQLVDYNVQKLSDLGYEVNYNNLSLTFNSSDGTIRSYGKRKRGSANISGDSLAKYWNSKEIKESASLRSYSEILNGSTFYAQSTSFKDQDFQRKFCINENRKTNSFSGNKRHGSLKLGSSQIIKHNNVEPLNSPLDFANISSYNKNVQICGYCVEVVYDNEQDIDQARRKRSKLAQNSNLFSQATECGSENLSIKGCSKMNVKKTFSQPALSSGIVTGNINMTKLQDEAVVDEKDTKRGKELVHFEKNGENKNNPSILGTNVNGQYGNSTKSIHFTKRSIDYGCSVCGSTEQKSYSSIFYEKQYKFQSEKSSYAANYQQYAAEAQHRLLSNSHSDYLEPPMQSVFGILDGSVKDYFHPGLYGKLPTLWLPVKRAPEKHSY
ncbi:hypothetical protein BB560_001123 [Smittium megazygosporum]|uniref:CSC1/OSCA1-like 7TM region domain-containing protein n=1 Tax=Smittium megazygosporum TaxID=133381 RepID=A0A2T9ZIF9_9FUNG|nr:hypothetical protein BB560_001123 [Smittium megazygosporum]